MQHNLAYYPTSLSRKAVALVAHGLNMKPTGMLAITQWLNSQGADVYLVKLSGHHEHSVNIKDITSTLWEEEMLNGYTVAKAAAVSNAVPLYFVGYSLGALLGQSLVLFSKEAICFDKQVLIAPATAIRSRGYLIKLLLYLNKKLLLPSFTPSPYRANNFLPVTAYGVVFRNERSIVAAQFNKLNIPTLIFIDPRDELISYKKLVQFTKRFSLDQYEVITLNSNLKMRQSRYHHLIVSEQTMGNENWKIASGKMAAFLFPSE